MKICDLLWPWQRNQNDTLFHKTSGHSNLQSKNKAELRILFDYSLEVQYIYNPINIACTFKQMIIRGENVSWQQGCCWTSGIWRHSKYGGLATEKLWQCGIITPSETSYRCESGLKSRLRCKGVNFSTMRGVNKVSVVMLWHEKENYVTK